MRGLPWRSSSRIVARTLTRLRRFSIRTFLFPTGTRTFLRLFGLIENLFEPRANTRRRCFFALLEVRTRLAVFTFTAPLQFSVPVQVSRIGVNLPLTSLTERPEMR